jgi:hypothetical protein
MNHPALPSPPQKQVLRISQDGSIHGLHVEGGFDYKALGLVESVRVSEIKWDTVRQRWFIQFLRGPLAGRKLTKVKLKEYGVVSARADQCSYAVAYYLDYRAAVADEVEVVNAAAARGEAWVECPRPGRLARAWQALRRYAVR